MRSHQSEYRNSGTVQLSHLTWSDGCSLLFLLHDCLRRHKSFPPDPVLQGCGDVWDDQLQHGHRHCDHILKYDDEHQPEDPDEVGLDGGCIVWILGWSSPVTLVLGLQRVIHGKIRQAEVDVACEAVVRAVELSVLSYEKNV